MKADPMHVREMTEDDLPAVSAIERASFPIPWSEELLRMQLGLADTIVSLVAVEGNVVVGYVSAWFGYRELHILSLAVDPPRRGSGAADLLLAAALERGAGRGCDIVVLEVRESNARAQRFYHRHGFRPIGRRPRYYPDSGEDALVLQRDIAEKE